MYQKKKARSAENKDNDFRKGKVEIQRAGQDQKINGKLYLLWKKM